jgi:hypothetical protein
MEGAGSDGERPVGHHPAAERAGGKGRHEERDSGLVVSLTLSTGPVVQVSWSTTGGRGVVLSVMVISLAPSIATRFVRRPR